MMDTRRWFVDRSAGFWDRMAERYSRRPVADEETYQKKLDITRRYFSPDMQVLEFGCGTGSTAIAHAPYVRHIDAIDVSSEMIRIARGKAEAAAVANVTFETAAIGKLPAAERAFDAVLGHNILHLLPDRNEVIAKVYDVLKPGGIFVTSTACIGDDSRLLGLILRAITPLGSALGLLPLVRVFTTGELMKDLAAAGFQVEHEWRPGKYKAVFIVAKKIEQAS